MSLHIMQNRYAMLLLSFLMACSAVYFLPGGDDVRVYDDIIRIHVVANSDSPYDQQLKYKVRDEVLEVGNVLLADCKDVECALQILQANINILCESAQEIVLSDGAGYGAAATVTKEFYPTRSYGNVRLPAGRYNSLKITLGEGKGRNWWCMIYPSLCLKAATKHENAIISADAPYNYTVKFKILEWCAELTDKLKRQVI